MSSSAATFPSSLAKAVESNDRPFCSSQLHLTDEVRRAALHHAEGFPTKFFNFTSPSLSIDDYDTQASQASGFLSVFAPFSSASPNTSSMAAITVSAPRTEAVRTTQQFHLSEEAYKLAVAEHKSGTIVALGTAAASARTLSVAAPLSLAACLERAVAGEGEWAARGASQSSSCAAVVAVTTSTLIVPTYTMRIDPFKLVLDDAFVAEVAGIAACTKTSAAVINSTTTTTTNTKYALYQSACIDKAEKCIREYGAFFVDAPVTGGIRWSKTASVRYDRQCRRDGSPMAMSGSVEVKGMGPIAAIHDADTYERVALADPLGRWNVFGHILDDDDDGNTAADAAAVGVPLIPIWKLLEGTIVMPSAEAAQTRNGNGACNCSPTAQQWAEALLLLKTAYYLRVMPTRLVTEGQLEQILLTGGSVDVDGLTHCVANHQCLLTMREVRRLTQSCNGQHQQHQCNRSAPPLPTVHSADDNTNIITMRTPSNELSVMEKPFFEADHISQDHISQDNQGYDHASTSCAVHFRIYCPKMPRQLGSSHHQPTRWFVADNFSVPGITLEMARRWATSSLAISNEPSSSPIGLGQLAQGGGYNGPFILRSACEPKQFVCVGPESGSLRLNSRGTVWQFMLSSSSSSPSAPSTPSSGSREYTLSSTAADGGMMVLSGSKGGFFSSSSSSKRLKLVAPRCDDHNAAVEGDTIFTLRQAARAHDDAVVLQHKKTKYFVIATTAGNGGLLALTSDPRKATEFLIYKH